MAPASLIDQITERFDELLARHEALRRTNAQLNREITDVTAERDRLKARMLAAGARLDALIARIPVNTSEPQADAATQPQESET